MEDSARISNGDWYFLETEDKELEFIDYNRDSSQKRDGSRFVRIPPPLDISKKTVTDWDYIVGLCQDGPVSASRTNVGQP